MNQSIERYPFPRSTRESQARWADVRNERCEMDEHQRKLYDAVAAALSAGLHYTTDVNVSVGQQLGEYFQYPDDPGHHVEGGVRGMEIYYARQAYEERQMRSRNRTAAKRFHAGQKVRGLRLGCDKYSTALVEDTDQEMGELRLFLTKRGSSSRWRATVGAAIVAAECLPEVS